MTPTKRQRGDRGESGISANSPILTVDDLAGYLHIHASTVYRLVKSGELPGFKVGADWRFHRAVIEQWMEHASPAQVTAEPRGQGKRKKR